MSTGRRVRIQEIPAADGHPTRQYQAFVFDATIGPEDRVDQAPVRPTYAEAVQDADVLALLHGTTTMRWPSEDELHRPPEAPDS